MNLLKKIEKFLWRSIQVSTVQKTTKFFYGSQIETHRVFNDTLYGSINLPHHIWTIIETAEFQRLRFVTQMGCAFYIYPSATHTRFEHSVGTFHLANKLLLKLKNQIKIESLELEITDDIIKCVEIAALCHDLGHGPYSHMWECEVIHQFVDESEQKSHEELSVEIFKCIVNDETYQLREKIPLTDEMIEQICRLILGTPNQEKDTGRQFLFDIVTNNTSGLDVDKFDYVCRDLINLEHTNGNLVPDMKKLIKFMRLVKNENEEWCLAMKDEEIFSVHNLYFRRHLLHKNFIHHQSVKAVKCMFQDAMAIIINDKELFKELITNVMGRDMGTVSKSFLCKSDFIRRAGNHHIWSMMCRHITEIADKIEMRHLYKLYCVLGKISGEEKMSSSEILRSIKKLELCINRKLNVAKLFLMPFQTGNGKANPLLQIPFYQKNKPHSTFKYTAESLPRQEEILNKTQIQVFCTRDLSGDERQKINEMIREWCDSHMFIIED